MTFWNDAKRNARLARIMFEIARPTTPSNAARRIQLCQEGLQLTDNVGFQSMLHFKLGMAYAENSQGESVENIELALEAFQTALHLSEQAPPLPRHRASIQLNLGTTYADRRRGNRADNIEKALAAYEAALTVFTYEAAPGEWAMLKTNLGHTYMERLRGERAENIEKAIQFYNDALVVRNRQALPQKWAALQNDLGTSYVERLNDDQAENIEVAIALFKQTIEVSQQENDSEQWAMAHQNLGGAYVKRIYGKRSENIEEALRAFEEALNRYSKEYSLDRWLETQINTATALTRRVQGKRTENLERALQLCLEVLDICSRNTFPAQWANANYELGNIYLNRIEGERGENLELGIEASRNALTVYTPAGFLLDWAMTQNGLAMLYEKRIKGIKAENLELALELCRDTLAALTLKTSPMHWANTKHTLGLVYTNRVSGERAENIERGITAINEALTVFTEHNFPEMWALTNNTFGAAYQNRLRGDRGENLELAIKAYQNSLTFSTQETLPEEWARIEHNLGVAYVDRVQGDKAENLELAIQAFQNALLVRSRTNLPLQWVMTQDALGASYRNRIHGNKADNIEKALEAHKAALTGCSREAAPELWPVVQHNLGVAYDSREKGEKEQNVREAIAAYEASIEVYLEWGLAKDARDTSIMLATLLLENKRAEDAYKVLQRAIVYAESLYAVALTEEGKRAEIAMNSRLYRHTVEACLALDPPLLREAFLYAEESRSRLLRDQLSMLSLPPLVTLPSDLLALESDLITQLRDLENAGRIAPDETLRQQWVDQALTVRQHLHNLWDQMIADYQANDYVMLRRGEKVTWEQVQHWLHSQPKHIALIAFYMLIEQIVVFVVREGNVEPEVIHLSVSQEEMLAYVMRCWREVYEFDEQEPLRETWQAIGKLEGEIPLLDQLMPHLSGAELVYLIPYGLLHLLPLHALKYENKPLIMYTPVAYLPSVAIALRMRQQRSTLSSLKQEDVLVLGNPTGDLPDAEEEARVIAHRFGTRPFAPADATKERVRAAFQHKQLIHLATHAAFNDIDPFASGIMLAPDWQNSTSNVKRVLNNQERDITILTAYEVLADHLLTNLVVLSACETGQQSINAGDEQDGFARAFLYAGVPSLLLSKWDVDSEKTRALILDFYHHLYDAEGRQRVSIADALQTAMIAGYEKWQFTYYWAPFILFGNWQ